MRWWHDGVWLSVSIIRQRIVHLPCSWSVHLAVWSKEALHYILLYMLEQVSDKAQAADQEQNGCLHLSYRHLHFKRKLCSVFRMNNFSNISNEYLHFIRTGNKHSGYLSSFYKHSANLKEGFQKTQSTKLDRVSGNVRNVECPFQHRGDPDWM